ncbi:hypothetical protein Ctha_1752 [Chloroherpeton thalassium ATCC 35110]|uniref:Uncharacterized protein n=1 Tax=Chloroherpeton thalassium (strain ATCC 35110 / GB-78) TaxID=517418 RepID=B3QTB0_CHLT3|nr:hypothetical protein Ctha_1752 [Chloroherpeton thalassium ATCC 35110]
MVSQKVHEVGNYRFVRFIKRTFFVPFHSLSSLLSVFSSNEANSLKLLSILKFWRFCSEKRYNISVYNYDKESNLNEAFL